MARNPTAKAAAAALGLAAGGYSLMAFAGVYAAKLELRAIKQRLEEETAAREDLEARIGRQQSRAGCLSDECDQLEKSLGETDARLEGLRNEVQQLELHRQQTSERHIATRRELAEARRQTAKLQRDFLQRNASFLEAEKAAAAAQAAAEARRREVNPLNHPRVRELLSR